MLKWITCTKFKRIMAKYSKVLLFCTASILGTLTYGQEVYNFTGNIQTYTVPEGVHHIQIEAYGAQGGNSGSFSGGLGASMEGRFEVEPGQVLNILVGEWPGDRNNGGGGGTFVVEKRTDEPLIIAGGGGGASGDCTFPANGMPGVATENGTVGMDAGCSEVKASRAGKGGVGGDQKNLGSGGGGGFYSAGEDGQNKGSGGESYLDGGAGGLCYDGSHAGYGGGGGYNDNGGTVLGTGGGGGGYSGGAGNCGFEEWGNGGGGGSYNVGTDQENTSGTNNGHGKVVITALPSNDVPKLEDVQQTVTPSTVIYPNPNQGEFKIEQAGDFHYSITNLKGEIVLEGDASNQKSIDLSEQPKGVYLVKILSKDKEETVKIIRE
jgi:hypothetical protein